MKFKLLKKRFFPGTLFLIVALVATLSWILLPSTASALSVDLGVVNESIGITGPYGNVTVTDTAESVTFTVQAFEDVLSTGDTSSFGIQEFYFNTDLSLTQENFSNLPDGWNVQTVTPPPIQADGFGRFSIVTDTQGANDRKDPLTFTITHEEITGDENFYFLSDTPAGNGQGHFAAHIAGWSPSINGFNSAYFRDGDVSIPDVSAVFLLGSACLIGFAGLRRKFEM